MEAPVLLQVGDWASKSTAPLRSWSRGGPRSPQLAAPSCGLRCALPPISAWRPGGIVASSPGVICLNPPFPYRPLTFPWAPPSGWCWSPVTLLWGLISAPWLVISSSHPSPVRTPARLTFIKCHSDPVLSLLRILQWHILV